MAEETVDGMIERGSTDGGIRVVEGMMRRIQNVAYPHGDENDVTRQGTDEVGLEQCAEDMDSLWESERLELDELASNLDHATNRQEDRDHRRSDSAAKEVVTQCRTILEAMKEMLGHMDERLASVDNTMQQAVEKAVTAATLSQKETANSLFQKHAAESAKRASQNIDDLNLHATGVVDSLKQTFEKATTSSLNEMTAAATKLLADHMATMTDLKRANIKDSEERESQLARQLSRQAENLRDRATEHLGAASNFLTDSDGQLSAGIERVLATALTTANEAHASAMNDLLTRRMAELDRKSEEYTETVQKEAETATATIRIAGNNVARRLYPPKPALGDGGPDDRGRADAAVEAARGSRGQQPPEKTGTDAEGGTDTTGPAITPGEPTAPAHMPTVREMDEHRPSKTDGADRRSGSTKRRPAYVFATSGGGAFVPANPRGDAVDITPQSDTM